MEKIILVTGSAGFIGFHLCKRLLEMGYKVIGIDNLNEYYDKKLKLDRNTILEKDNNFTFYKIDICNYSSLSDIITAHQPKFICNLAAQPGVRYSLIAPFVYGDSNLTGFLSVLEAARNFGLKLIFASSSSIYGDNSSEEFLEDMKTDSPISLYAATKKANEVMAYSYAHLFQISIIGLRFFTVYGPWGRPDMALFKFTKKILEGDTIDIYNMGEMFRDFTYVDDIVEGILKTLEYNPPLGDIEIFNLGCGNPRKLMDFVKLIEKYCEKEAKFNLLPIQPGDVLRTSAGISKARNLLKFDPQFDIEEGVKRFVKWYVEYYY